MSSTQVVYTKTSAHGLQHAGQYDAQAAQPHLWDLLPQSLQASIASLSEL